MSAATNEAAYYRALFEELCGYVRDMVHHLEPGHHCPDAWTLRDAILKLKPSTVEPPQEEPVEFCVHGNVVFGAPCKGCLDMARGISKAPAKPTAEPAREHGGHPSTCPACAAKPTAEEKPEPHRARHSIKDFWCPAGVCETCCATCFRCAHNGHEGTCPQGLRARAEAAEKSLETANGLLARAAGALGLVDSVSANEAREAIRAHLSLKGAK